MSPGSDEGSDGGSGDASDGESDGGAGTGSDEAAGDHADGRPGGTEVAPPPAERDAIATTVGTARDLSATSVPPINSGDLLGDRYRVREMIGAGGMGMVFLAEHTTINKPVAIKVLGEEFSNRPALVERFMQEARAASLIRHPNSVDITDFGFVREGVPYFVMEYLEGQTLADRIAEQRRLPWPTARDVIVQICTALQAAHDKGVIHRDMKPENVFLIDRGGERPFVKVLDFGIAKIVAEGDKNLTKTGTVMGTAAYMSPEQAQSLPLDRRTDIYATGIILYEMLTGQVPFDAGGFVGVLTKHVSERVPSMSRMAPEARIPRALDRAVLRALRKDRDERYETAAAFATALRDLGDDAGATRWRTYAPLGLGAGALVAAVAWVAGGVGTPDPSPTPKRLKAAPPAAAAPAPAPEPEPEPEPQPEPEARPVTRVEPASDDATVELPNIGEVPDAIEEGTTTTGLPEVREPEPRPTALPGLDEPGLRAGSSSGASPEGSEETASEPPAPADPSVGSTG